MKAKTIKGLKFIGLGFLEPLIRLIKKENPQKNTKEVFRRIIAPLASVFIFIGVWQISATALYNIEVNYKIENIKKNQGTAAVAEFKDCLKLENSECKPNTLPSPKQVYNAYLILLKDHKQITKDKKAFENKTLELNKKRVAQGKKAITYTGRPSFVDQIITSLKTVFAGFLLAFVISIPVGIITGLSKTLRNSINWIIQIFKPVSPVVWLLLVYMIVKTLTKNSNNDNSFIISFISVGLCSMWPAMINTAMAVSSVNPDYINVARVLQLKPTQKIFKIILPASLPLIFTGLRITLSVAWMVLIAIELLAQSPGLGSFVWEEFQNGAMESNSKIIVAMFVIGFIGFVLDRIMLLIQNLVSHH